MKNNAIQTVILALVGFAILFVGFLLFICVGGETTPEHAARFRDLFGAFAWFADILERIATGLLGAGLMYLGYKVYPFHDGDAAPEEKSADNMTSEIQNPV